MATKPKPKPLFAPDKQRRKGESVETAVPAAEVDGRDVVLRFGAGHVVRMHAQRAEEFAAAVALAATAAANNNATDRHAEAVEAEAKAHREGTGRDLVDVGLITEQPEMTVVHDEDGVPSVELGPAAEPEVGDTIEPGDGTPTTDYAEPEAEAEEEAES